MSDTTIEYYPIPANNMAIWELVDKTDPSYAKKATNGRFSFTCIDPQWQLLQATKLWGPYGNKWGLRDIRFTCIDHAVDKSVQSMMLNGLFYYPIDGTTGEFPIAVDLKFRPGDDVCKKLLTSARSKALSYLGFSADAYLGMFDDAAYVSEIGEEFSAKNAFQRKVSDAIKSAKTNEALDNCMERLNTILKDGTMDAITVQEMLSVLAARRVQINS